MKSLLLRYINTLSMLMEKNINKILFSLFAFKYCGGKLFLIHKYICIFQKKGVFKIFTVFLLW